MAATPAGSVSGESECSSSCASSPLIAVHGVGTRSRAPLESALLGEHGDEEYFILTVMEIAAGAAPRESGTAALSTVYSGGKFYRIEIRGVEEPPKSHKNDPFAGDILARALAAEKNAEAFTDEDGDFDYVKAGWPVDVWQMAYGKVVAPLQHHH